MLSYLLQLYYNRQQTFVSIFPVPQAPPVGLYDVLHEKQGPGAGFGKGKRFADLKGEKYMDEILPSRYLPFFFSQG